MILDGKIGDIKSIYFLLGDEVYDCIIFVNLIGDEYKLDVLFKDWYKILWVFDYDFNFLWKYEGNVGYFLWVYDIDVDGKDEVMVGYDMFDYDGSLLWFCIDLDDYVDCIWFGDVNGDG